MDNNEDLYQKLGEVLLTGAKEFLTGFAGKDVVIRHGDALPLREQAPVKIKGTIEAPKIWLEKKITGIDQSQCHIEVNREEMSILLVINEESYYKDTVKGSLVLSPEFLKFGINNGKYISGIELSDFIRMNRSYFENKQTAMALVSICRNFKAKVNKDMEVSKDTRGNYSGSLRQVVDANTPSSFEVVIPIFRGGKKVKFAVEIDINPETLQMTLVSPDAQDIIEDCRDKVIGSELDNIKAIAPNIPIIEI